MTKGAPWKGIDSHGCGWWIEHGVDALVVALRNAMSLPRAVLDEMGARGVEWVKRDYSWDAIAKQMAAVYQWLECGGDSPETVMLQ